MNLLCDEGVERPVVAALRQQGHSVLYVAETQPGISDDAVLAMAAEQRCPLVTNDKDFGELVFGNGAHRQELSFCVWKA